MKEVWDTLVAVPELAAVLGITRVAVRNRIWKYHADGLSEVQYDTTKYPPPLTVDRGPLAANGRSSRLAGFHFDPTDRRLHWLGLKRGLTGRLNDAQREFAEWCAEHGVPHAITRDFSEALAVLQGCGAVRTGIAVSC